VTVRYLCLSHDFETGGKCNRKYIKYDMSDNIHKARDDGIAEKKKE